MLYPLRFEGVGLFGGHIILEGSLAALPAYRDSSAEKPTALSEVMWKQKDQDRSLGLHTPSPFPDSGNFSQVEDSFFPLEPSDTVTQ
jgi:hypothetical protein